MSKFNNLSDYLLFFTFKYSFITSNYHFYRPLTTQAYFGFMRTIFGLNPFYFHLASLLVHIANIFLVYKLTEHFIKSKSKFFAIVAALFYGINPSNTIAIGWAVNMQVLAVTFFIILSFLFFLKALEKNKRGLWVSILLFIFALLSKETAIVFPFVLTAAVLLFDKLKNLKKVIPYFLILALYLYIHFIKYHFEQTENYTLIFNLQVINTLKWYFLWALGLPELFLDYIGPKFRILPQLWLSYPRETLLILSSFFVFISSFIVLIVLTIKKIGLELIDKKIVFFTVFYLAFLLPVIFFPNNKYPYHQTTALIGFSILVTLYLSKFAKAQVKLTQKLTFLIIFSFTILSFISINLTLKTNWLINRSKITGSVFEAFRQKYPTLDENSVIYVKNDPNYPFINKAWGGSAKQSYMALHGDLAFRVYYSEGVKVYYEGIENLPDNIDKSKLIEYTARINY